MVCLRGIGVTIRWSLAGLSREDAAMLLERGDRSVKLALMMHWSGLDKAQSQALLTEHGGHLRKAVEASRT